MLCLGHEGVRLPMLADHGIAAFVLKYRLAREQDSKYTVDDHAMADTRRAISPGAQSRRQWHIQPDRIGILGLLGWW